MITYEQITEANGKLPRLEIRGKAYAAVPARIAAFRSMCPNGSIQTEIISLVDGVVTMKTTVYDEDGKILATGLAQEKEGATNINRTSFIENCETSAVGRALGMIGIGSEAYLTSAEELVFALSAQDKPETIDGVMVTALEKRISTLEDVKLEKILEHYGLESLKDMDVKQYRDCVAYLNKYEKKSKDT